MVQLSVHHFYDLLRYANFFLIHKFGGLCFIKWILPSETTHRSRHMWLTRRWSGWCELTWCVASAQHVSSALQGEMLPPILRQGKTKSLEEAACSCGQFSAALKPPLLYTLLALQALLGQILRLKKTKLVLCSSCPQRVCNICKYKQTLSFYLCTRSKK